MKKKTPAADAPAAMNPMMPMGPAIGYSETRTYVLTDGQGHSTKVISDYPLKSIKVGEEELPHLWDSLVQTCGPGHEEARDPNPKQELKEKETGRFDDDGSAWL